MILETRASQRGRGGVFEQQELTAAPVRVWSAAEFSVDGAMGCQLPSHGDAVGLRIASGARSHGNVKLGDRLSCSNSLEVR